MTLADKIRPHVGTIQREAANGSDAARHIITLYQMHVRCPRDPAAPALCEAAFDEWHAKHAPTDSPPLHNLKGA